MNIETNSYEKSSPNCKGCKLFFGAEAYQGYCSTCYKKQQVQSKEPLEKKAQPPSPTTTANKVQQPQQPVAQENRNKCQTCSRKLKNLGIECKCGHIFCTLHRLPQDHACSFDHMNVEKKKLEKALVKVANTKIGMIQ